MNSTRLVSHLAMAAVLLAAPVAWAQATPPQSGQMNPSGSQMNQSGSSATERSGSATDIALESRVKQALQNDNRLATSDISVNAKGNVVYLTGSVDNHADRTHAVDIASKVDGVKKVEDKITIAKNTP